MKFSIITVCLNSELTIERTIKSVLNQTYKNIEYIIIDGMSTDRTMNIVNSYKDSIHTVISEKDNGLYDAMNKGITLAKGDIVGILNSDDIFFQNDVLESIVEVFKTNNELSMVYGNIVYVSSVNPEKVVRNWRSIAYFDNFFEYGHVPPHPSLFIRRHELNKVGLFNLKYKFAADYEFMLRCFKVVKLRSFFLDKYIVKMQLGGKTNASLSNIIKGNREILNAWKTNGFHLPFFLIPLRIINRLIQFVK